MEDRPAEQTSLHRPEDEFIGGDRDQDTQQPEPLKPGHREETCVLFDIHLQDING